MDVKLRDAERAYSIDKTETNRITWVTELLRSGLLTKPPFGVQMKSDGRAVGSGWQAAKNKWYLIARVEPSQLIQTKGDHQTTLCVIHRPHGIGSRQYAFTCTPKDLNAMWLQGLVAYRPEKETKSVKEALVDWYQKGGAYLNPGASLMRYSARDYRDLLT